MAFTPTVASAQKNINSARTILQDALAQVAEGRALHLEGALDFRQRVLHDRFHAAHGALEFQGLVQAALVDEQHAVPGQEALRRRKALAGSCLG